jgi:hypothetical protein
MAKMSGKEVTIKQGSARGISESEAEHDILPIGFEGRSAAGLGAFVAAG